MVKERQDNKKRKLKLNLKKFISFLLVLTGMLLLSYIWFFTDLFHIKSIEILDNKKIEESTLKEVSGLTEGDNIFLIKTSDAADNIKSIGYVKEVNIIRVFPDKLKVYITERDPVCIVVDGGDYIYVDDQGIVAEVVDHITVWSLPLVTGLENTLSEKYEAKKLGVEPTWVGNNVLGILEVLRDYELSEKVSEINVTKEKQLHIYTNGGSIIKVRDKENIESKIDFLYTYLTENDDRMIVDLTHGGNPTYTPR